MDIAGKGGRAAEARPIALLETWGIACGYVVSPELALSHDTAPCEVPADLSEILDGVLRIAVVLMSIVGTFAVSRYALSAVMRW